jgi:hypothetical protein
MTLHTRKLLTIVSEAALESALIKQIELLGASGYTVSDVRGNGNHGMRDAAWPASSNIRIEVICEELVAEAIAHYVQEHYYENYAMVLFLSDVQVLRSVKF